MITKVPTTTAIATQKRIRILSCPNETGLPRKAERTPRRQARKTETGTETVSVLTVGKDPFHLCIEFSAPESILLHHSQRNGTHRPQLQLLDTTATGNRLPSKLTEPRQRANFPTSLDDWVTTALGPHGSAIVHFGSVAAKGWETVRLCHQITTTSEPEPSCNVPHSLNATLPIRCRTWW